jgi:hypothetical protein
MACTPHRLASGTKKFTDGWIKIGGEVLERRCCKTAVNALEMVS